MSVYERFSESQQFACRVIADHARATAFAIADGILPGNEGRNYVLRKIMRRAIYHGREHLGLTEPFFYKVCDFVVDNMHGAYPELETQRDFIGKMVRLEEEKFTNTLVRGLEEFISEYKEFAEHHERISEIIWSLPFFATDEERSQWKHKVEGLPQADQRNLNEILADLSFKHRIPPYLVESVVESRLVTQEGSRLEETEYNRNMYRSYLAILLREKGSDREKELVSQLQIKYGEVAEKELVGWLNVLFDGAGELNAVGLTRFAKLYDTYGLTPDLIRVQLEERGLKIDEAEFDESFQLAHQELQKQGGIGQTQRKGEISPLYAQILAKVGANTFHGYDTTQHEDAKVVAILDGDMETDELGHGAQGSVILDQTPFYAESGGQVGDMGKLGNAAASATVNDTFSPVAGLIIHKVTVDKGSIKVGDTVTAMVDVEKRDATRRNHTATHLVHAALKEVLGSHVKQAGSVVAPNYLRFDFTHYQPMTAAEIAEVEDLVNRYIIKNEPVTTDIRTLEDAMRSGAVAMFGEKYGGEVRVLSVGDGAFSKELCGGTHVRATGDIGSFKITTDEAIASGVRRIRAITGLDAFERFREDERLIDASLGALNTQRDNLPHAIAKLAEELKKTRKEMDELKLKIAMGQQSAVSGEQDETRDVAGIRVLAKTVDGLDANGQRQLSDTLLARLKSGVVILGRSDEDKVSIIVRVSDDLTDRVKAGNVIKEIVPIVGGKGGGRADMAEGGGTEPARLAEAIDAAYGVVEKMLR